MSTYREATLQVSNQTKWSLVRVVRGRNAAKGEDDLALPATTDALADKILAEWITANYPQLDALYDQREALDSQAVEAVKLKQPGIAVPF